ncbi:DUF805 domain-containing protein [Bifidobacterium amazonense]|uniref:DUF805 domain-containing protein n=1 Tax=Bifidobacterium amazonense TaxID=2809027 RepID=A0ABS9VWG0_9BIFI|nr:DUF805 domain-containing protein [Bifidobacterium amazonense]MCH9276140.1 DUF805 domain-containing protein [Bifidobacterium amazonense]
MMDAGSNPLMPRAGDGPDDARPRPTADPEPGPEPYMTNTTNPYTTYVQRMAGAHGAWNDGVAGRGRGAEPPSWSPWYGVGFGRAIGRFFRKSFVFHGRASRGEYWWAQLFNWLLDLVLIATVTFATWSWNLPVDDGTAGGMLADVAGYGVQLVLFIPNLSLTMRRLHDANLRGWWSVLPFALEIGAFVAFAAVVGFGSGGDRPGGDQPVGSGSGGSGSGGSDADVQTLIVAVLAALGLMLLSGLVSIVLMILPSDPRGARFDRPQPVSAGEPMTGAPMPGGGSSCVSAHVSPSVPRSGPTDVSQRTSPSQPGA